MKRVKLSKYLKYDNIFSLQTYDNRQYDRIVYNRNIKYIETLRQQNSTFLYVCLVFMSKGDHPNTHMKTHWKKLIVCITFFHSVHLLLIVTHIFDFCCQPKTDINKHMPSGVRSQLTKSPCTLYILDTTEYIQF